MPQSLNKVTKKITRKKGRITGLHEHSRDAKKLRKAGLREERVHRVQHSKAKHEEGYVHRIAYFQAALRDVESTHSVAAQVLKNFSDAAIAPEAASDAAATAAAADTLAQDTAQDAAPDTLPDAPSSATASASPSAQFTIPALQSLVEAYLSQNRRAHPSLRSTKIELPFTPNRPARPTAPAEDRAAARHEAVEREYATGFWMPDLRDEEGREKLRRWRGDWGGLGEVPFIRLDRGGGVKASKFPPRGGV